MRTEVHAITDQDRWLIKTSVRNTHQLRLVAGARAKPTDLVRIAEWTVPSTAEAALQLRNTIPDARWAKDAVTERRALLRSRKNRVALQADATISGDVITPTGVKEKLAPFQMAGVMWLMATSGILADDMGLGKTVELCWAAQQMQWVAGNIRILVLCPTSALGVWEEHLQHWTSIEPFVFHGPRRAKIAGEFQDYEGPKALVSTHGLVERHSDRVNYGATPKEGKPGIFNDDYDLLIVDEGHKIGVDPHGKRVRATRSITQSCDRVWISTGTPVNDAPRDLWVLMSYVNDQVFGSYQGFCDRTCIVRDGKWNVRNLGLHPDLEDEYEWMIKPWMLRRLKSTHGQDIPDALPPQMITLPMSGPQSKAYNTMVSESLALLDQDDGSKKLLYSMGNLPKQQALEYLAAGVPIIEEGNITGLQHRNSNKFEYLKELAEDRKGDPFVIYAYSRREIEMYARGLTEAGFKVGTITGKTPRKQRDATISIFQQGGLDVILVTDAGGDSVTLTAADLIVLTRPSRRPLANQQVMDRINRWGQTRRPQTQILVSIGTVDETRLHSLRGKIQLQEEMTLDKKRLTAMAKGKIF